MTLESMLVVLAAVLPGAALFILLTRGRSLAPLLVCLGLGVLACVPALLLERILGHPQVDSLGLLVVFAMSTSIVEELCKFAVSFAAPAPGAEADDIIARFACIGLGFATAENIAYCLVGGASLALARAFTAVPAHAMFGIIIGDAVARARGRERVGWSSGNLVLHGLLTAILMHGLYDTLAFQGSEPALILLIFCLAAGTIWSLRTVRAAYHRQSPAPEGDHGVEDAAPGLPPPLDIPRRFRAARSPDTAALLGLIPGLGQWYNGQNDKAAMFCGLTAIDLALYAAAVSFARDPWGALGNLRSLGLEVRLDHTDVAALIDHRALLPVVTGVLLVLGWLWGALDAWWTAHARSRSTATQGAVLSYATHVVLLLALLLCPLTHLSPSGQRHEQQRRTASRPTPQHPEPEPTAASPTVTLTWVKITRLDGWKPPGQTAVIPAPRATVAAPVAVQTPPPRVSYRAPAVRPPPAPTPPRVVTHPSPRRTTPIDVPPPQVASGPTFRGDPTHDGPHHAPMRPGTDIPAGRDDGSGVAIARPGTGDRPMGVEGWFSYNQYLTARLHEGRPPRQDYFFKFVPQNLWVIVRYEIDASGMLVSADILDTSGATEDAQRAVAVVRSCAPFRPLPPGVARITVTELFWTKEFHDFPRNSLAESLSQLPDGRALRE